MTPPLVPSTSSTPEALLAERAWVRRVAGAIAGNDPDADDIAQDAWVSALRAPPTGGGTGRTWFRRVLRNRFAETLRGGARRRRREEAVAQPEALPSTEEIVARAEAHRRVVEAVFALDEPWRTTIVLRFFEELTPAEIAARAGVPADTVRARVRRGVELLRESLAPRDDRRAAWVVLLGPVGGSQALRDAAHASSPASVSSLSAPSGGIALSSSTTKSVAAVVCLLAIAGAAWFFAAGDGGDGADGVPGGAGDARTAAGGGTTTGDAAARAGDPDRAARGDAATAPSAVVEGAASVFGQVRFVSPDRPAAGAKVELRRGEATHATTTDASGAFRFDGVAPGGPAVVSASLAGMAPASQSGIWLDRGEARRLDVLRLDEPVKAEILVVAADGAPVADATVEAYRERPRIERQDWAAQLPEPETTARTDASGRVSLGALSVGTWTFRATHPEFAPGGLAPQTILRGGVALRLTLRLDRGHELTGRVLNYDGTPVVDALVLALPPVEAQELMKPVPVDARRVETKTAADGAFRFAALAAGEHALALVRPGSLPCRIGIVSLPSISHFEAVLDGGVLAGRVTEEGTGKPIEGARVRCAVWRRHSPTFLSAISAADGSYRLDVPLGGAVQGPARGEGGAAALPVHFDVEKEGWTYAADVTGTPWRQTFLFGGETIPYDLVMRPAASLSGRVIGPAGPVADAEVTADVWNPLRGSLPQTTRTDAEGRYRFGGVAAGRARLVVTSAGHYQAASPGDGWRGRVPPDPAAVVEVPARGAVEFDVRLERGLPLRGRVVDDGGAGVAAASVVVVSGGDLRREITTDGEGRFDVEGLRPGAECVVSVSCAGFAAAESRVTPADGGEPIAVSLTKLGRVRGRVLRADSIGGGGGAAAKGAWVQVVPAKIALDGAYEVVSIWARAVRQPVAADGSFDAVIDWMDGAAADGLVVRAGAPDLAPALSERLAAPKNGAAVDAGTLRLDAGHRLEGRVLAADGSGGVAGAEIEFMNEKLPPALQQRRDWSAVGRDSMPFEWVARTDADGRFSISGLPAWRYELRVNAQGHNTGTAIAAVPSDEAVTVELEKLAPIAGTAAYEDGAPAAGVIVVAHWTNGRQGVAGFTEVTADGRFNLPHLGAGTYQLEARRPNDRAMDVLPTRTDDIVAGRSDVKLVVKRGGASISGRCVTATGAAVPGASIVAKRIGDPASPVMRTRSGPDGRFAIASLEGGPWTISADANRAVGGPENYGRVLVAQAASVAAGATDVVLEFGDAAPIRGTLRRDDGSVPPGRIAVQARRGSGASAWTLTCPLLQDGAFRFDNAAAGPWTLSVIDLATGAAVRVTGPTEVTGGTTDVRLVVAAAASISGRVVDEQGRSVLGARVAATREGTAPLLTTTDDDGAFQFGDVGDATWTIVAAHDEAGRSDPAPAVPGSSGLVLKLVPQEIVAGTVRLADGAPLRNAVVQVTLTGQEPGMRRGARLRTGSDGRFSSRGLPAGEYDVALVERDGKAVTAVELGTVRSGASDVVLTVR